MAAPKPTYSFYVSDFNGQLDEADFTAQLTPAFIEVQDMITWKEVPSQCVEAFNMAVCAVIDVYAYNGLGVAGGFSVGSFSMSTPIHDVKKFAREQARKYLAPTGLLYAGV